MSAVSDSHCRDGLADDERIHGQRDLVLGGGLERAELLVLWGEKGEPLDAWAKPIDHRPDHALRHHDAGLSIDAFSHGKKFGGVLPWGLIDNRPFLRSLHGAGLCWWRLGKTREAAAVFRKMLCLNPGDHQGARFNLAAVETGKTWEEDGAER